MALNPCLISPTSARSFSELLHAIYERTSTRIRTNYLIRKRLNTHPVVYYNRIASEINNMFFNVVYL